MPDEIVSRYTHTLGRTLNLPFTQMQDGKALCHPRPSDGYQSLRDVRGTMHAVIEIPVRIRSEQTISIGVQVGH